MLFQLAFVLLVGCGQSGAQSIAQAAAQKQAEQIPKTSRQGQEQPGGSLNGRDAENASATDAVEWAHVIVTDAEYYTSGPQQGRPADGTFQAGTKVTLIEEVGSYSLVQAADGTRAYVAADALQHAQPKENPDVNTLVTGNNQFALDLYDQLRTAPGNLFFSPSSISTALAMTYAGAKAKTGEQVADVLHFAMPQERLHPAFAAWVDRLHSREREGIEIRIANRLWGQAGYEFLPTFLQTTREHYSAEVGQVDFVRQTEAARLAINTWIEQQTNGKITELIPTGVLNELTRLVLTNAIYFKGDWAHPFEPDATEDAPFHVSTNETVDVPMMVQQARFKYAAADEVQVLELPYVGDGLSMLILLPQEVDGLAALEQTLTLEDINQWSGMLRQQKVEVFLPRFQLTAQFRLGSVLRAMGMPAAFNPAEADFSGMTDTKELSLTDVVHKAYVDVNEEGTEAAAATGVVVGVTSIQVPPTFRADHPFVFAIRDNQTGSILFLGRVTNPTK